MRIRFAVKSSTVSLGRGAVERPKNRNRFAEAWIDFKRRGWENPTFHTCIFLNMVESRDVGYSRTVKIGVARMHSSAKLVQYFLPGSLSTSRD